MLTRRQLFPMLILSGAVPCMRARLHAQDGRKLYNSVARKSVQSGLKYLSLAQEENGTFGDSAYQDSTAIISLAGLSWLASGSVPGRGPFGSVLRRCVDYVVAQSDSSGLIASEAEQNKRPMYGHGFATLFLSQVYGMTRNPLVRTVLEMAVGLTLATQNSDGGWRYQPEKSDADISVTVCQAVALRGAVKSGFRVPPDTVMQCKSYLSKCQNPDGGFMYTHQGGESAFPRTGAALVGLFNCGIYEGDLVERGLAFLDENWPEESDYSSSPHYFYGIYYASHAYWQAGGERWSRWYKSIRDLLTDRQESDGNWRDEHVCNEYSTAMACLSLQMPNNHLPILRR